MIDSILAVGAILSANLADIPAQQLKIEDPIEEVKHHTNTQSQRGIASYYSNYYNGRRTASGTLFSNNSNQCAHRTLRFGTVVTIKNLSNGRTTTCRVTDRMPYYPNRVIDLSSSTFLELGNLEQGLLPVEISW
jgi:rare lipoprotein A (peptidoglycan hydrolase)